MLAWLCPAGVQLLWVVYLGRFALHPAGTSRLARARSSHGSDRGARQQAETCETSMAQAWNWHILTCVCLSLAETSYISKLSVKGWECVLHRWRGHGKRIEEWGVKIGASDATYHPRQCSFSLLPHQFLIRGSGTFLDVTHPMGIENESTQAWFLIWVFL